MTAARPSMRALPAAVSRPLSAVRSTFRAEKPGQSSARTQCFRGAVMIIIKAQETNIMVNPTDFTGITGSREFRTL
jgi:hypothetical protein